MGVIHGFHAPAGRAEGGDLDLGAAEMFVRAQGSWLARGLARAHDPVAVRLVLSVHDSSHASWLALIAAADRCLGQAAMSGLAALYALHGRVAGVLEQLVDDRLAAVVPTDTCEVLQRHLAEVTATAVASLHVPTPRP